MIAEYNKNIEGHHGQMLPLVRAAMKHTHLPQHWYIIDAAKPWISTTFPILFCEIIDIIAFRSMSRSKSESLFVMLPTCFWESSKPAASSL